MMLRLSQSEFVAARDAYDRAVIQTPGISQFCSSSTWALAARTHLLGLGDDDEEDAESAAVSLRLPTSAIIGDTSIWRDESADHWFLFGRSPWGYWQPFESAWMFACPMIGPDPAESFERLRQVVASDPERTPGFAIGGIPADGELHRVLREAAESRSVRQYREYPATDCLSIDLGDGWEPWLSRRSKKFRRSLQSSERRCHGAGLEMEFIEGKDADDAVFERLLALQPLTDKWATGTDIFQVERYRHFYRQIFQDLRDAGRLRLFFATRDGEDVAYIFGAVFGEEYRGLQMSYASEFAGLGVGNWLQMENLRRRADEGVIRYDLGMEAEYKLRWADERHAKLLAFLVP